MADGGDAGEPIALQHVEIHPNNCLIDDPLNLSMEFTTAVELRDARWEIKFVADQANVRKIIMLGETGVVDYAPGAGQRMDFHIDAMDVSGVKRHVLTNVGLLLATLYAGEEEIVQVSFVTQVTPDGGVLRRSVFSPLD